MSKRTRIIWSEGLLLSPQHLQLQDRYHEERCTEMSRNVRPFGHGLVRLVLDDDAIRNGQVILHEGAGVLPGGRTPESGWLPPKHGEQRGPHYP